MSRTHLILDTELLGNSSSGIEPVFLIKAKVHETGEWFTFWMHKRGHMAKFKKLLLEGGHTVVTFNGENFDRPLIAAALAGHDGYDLKTIAQAIIDERMVSWQTYREFDLEFLEYDHIDIMGVPPGVMLSLKTYEGRMHWHNLQDMPYPHDYVLKTPKEFKTVEQYCENDVLSTEALFETVKKDIDLRIELGERYELDLRSKSDAQVAEAILKSVVGIKSGEKFVPRAVQYTAPVFIETDSPEINALIERLEKTEFLINRNNGSPILPDWMTEPFRLGEGLYKFGLGGLHSQHDIRVCHRTDARTMISDIDAASYYPKIMIEAGLIPTLGGNKGETFLDTYEGFYHERVDAKREGDKRVAGTLKIVLNGTFGKLGSIYCSFYAPELMLAVTITGQLNLLCLIHEVEKVRGARVISANTDGIMIKYPKTKRAALIKAIQGNAKVTGFEYEETPYSMVGIRDVNNYIAITEQREMVIIPPKGKVVKLEGGPPSAKRKGAYAKAGVMENVSPTFQICADACANQMLMGATLTSTIYGCDDIRQFVSIRGVTGGGVQHKKEIEVDDWVCINDLGSAKSEWVRQAWLDEGWEPETGRASVKRKSRPAPVMVGVGGEPFGRVARWYMTTKKQPAITYVGSGNKVPNTDGSQLCMKLPDKVPDDLDHEWYVAKAAEMLVDLGIES
jgi:hypothetical protein